MPEVVEDCGLCGEKKTLRRSHFLPKALYRLCRSPEEENPNPTLVNRSGVVQTSDQIVGHFLCGTCEELFSQCGESWVIPRVAKADGSFPLREPIVERQPRLQRKGGSFYDFGEAFPDAVEPLLYFALSIFWRCASRQWKSRGRVLHSIELGPYEPVIRDFLLRRASFPTTVAMTVVLDSRKEPDILFSPPVTSRKKGIIKHKFQIPGIMFMAFVGKSIPDAAPLGFLSPPAPHGILVRDLREISLAGFADLMRSAEGR